MKKTRAISLLLSLPLICAMLVPGAAAYAENGSGDSGMVIHKTATANDDGSYTIELEAYATGDKIISQETKDVPTDIVLVLDQSGSMSEDIGSVSFSQYEDKTVGFSTTYHTRNQDYYECRHNGGSANLWHQLTGGTYVSVSVTLQQTPDYTEIKSGMNGSTQGNSTSYWSNKNNLYAKVSGEYVKVTVIRTSSNGTYTYTYTLPDGTVIAKSSGRNGAPEFSGVDGNVLYLLSVNEDQNVYTYTYTDANGATQTIGTSTGASTVFSPVFYRRNVSTSGGGSRLSALKTAVTSFANAVAQKAAGADGILGNEDDVNHRIAVVGFASGSSYNGTNYNYGNTEVFVGSRQYTYGASAQGVYGSALQAMNTEQGKSNISASIGALADNGGTLANLGLEMANGILDANPVAEGAKRNRVVIVFTDGVPGWSGYDSSVADAAISQAGAAKNTYGASVYTVGIFSGADATNAGSQNGNETQKANWFMQNLSSNNGTPRIPSYYLSAADAATLNSIFQQIASQIETGGSSTTLSDETVIKDIVAPAFTLPNGASTSDITLETYACTGKSGDTYTWTKNNGTMGASAVIGSTDTANAITTNNQVSVTGFDFAENYVGTVTENGNVTYRGNKLVIKFTVTPRPGFFGGNGVATNTSAGIYENSSATEPVLTFERPTVDVPLAKPDVTVPDANVYLGAYYSQTVPDDAVKMGATVKIGGYDIDFSKANNPDHPYGLEPWQVEYVNITISAATEGNGGSFENIQEDISYTVTVTVAPKTQGSSGDQSATDTGTGTIHVFKPQLTFKDSDVWYGGDAPTDFSSNLEEETWINSDGTKKHDDAGVQMLNEKPTLSLTYTPDATKIKDGKINTKQDIPVKVDVTMPVGQAQTQTNVNGHTTFKHEDCAGQSGCSWSVTTLNGDPAFLLHVKTCMFTITKQNGATDEPYVFTINKDGEAYTQATIVPKADDNNSNSVTIYELPVGTYTIQEDTGWSWRYPNPTYTTNPVTLSATCDTGSIICTNMKTQNFWLNGYSQVVRNIFGANN